MAIRKAAKSKSSGFDALARLLPDDVAAVVCSEAMDLSNVSLFCRRQVECATLFNSIVQIKPGVLMLKSPFKENFIGSLHAYLWLNANFSPEEMVANALVRHVTWYLKVRDIDAVRERAGAERINPSALRGSMKWIEGIIRPTGEFTRDAEADGNPAILAWQHNPGNPPNFAIEVKGPNIADLKGPVFRTLLQSMVDSISIEMGLKRPNAGRPHLAPEAEEAAYLRDHQKAGRTEIAKRLCSCGSSRHTQKCFDRLNKLADSYYRTQRSAFEKLVRKQTRKYPEINS